MLIATCTVIDNTSDNFNLIDLTIYDQLDGNQVKRLSARDRQRSTASPLFSERIQSYVVSC